MGVTIELTPEQEAVVLAAYGYEVEEEVEEEVEDEAAPSRPPSRPEEAEPEAIEITFDKLYGFPFGKPHNGSNKDLPLTTSDGLVTWRFFVEEDLAVEAGVSDHGGDFHIHTVADELAKWPEGQGYDAIRDKIYAMDLPDEAFAVFPENIGQVEVEGVEFDGRPWALEMWQEGVMRYVISGPGKIPPKMCKFTLYQSGPTLGVQYYWK